MAAEASVALMHRITNVRLPGPLPGDGDQRYAIDLDEQGLICRIEAMGGKAQQEEQQETQETDADWNGNWLSPRGVDLQINGGLGLAFPELTSADLPRLEELLDLLWRDGVEAIAPTLVTCGIAPLRQALAVLRQRGTCTDPAVAGCWGPIWRAPFWPKPAAVPIPVNTWPAPAWRLSRNGLVGSKRRLPWSPWPPNWREPLR